MTNSGPPDHGTHIFRISLAEARKIRRDIEIASSLSLHRLAEEIVAAFDFDFDHAFGFYPETSRAKVLRARPCYELFADMGEESDGFSVERTAIAEAFARPKQKMMFLFDYGDMWLFRVELLGFGKMDAEAARIVSRQGRAPEQYPSEEELEYDDEDEDDGE